MATTTMMMMMVMVNTFLDREREGGYFSSRRKFVTIVTFEDALSNSD